MSIPPFPAGSILEGVQKGGHFAHGGHADLYRGYWTRNLSDTVLVAIKLIRRCDSDGNDEAPEHIHKRFMRELQSWHKLQHPHIVPIHGMIIEDDRPGLVMPYYKNGHLMRFLRNNPQVDRLELIYQAATGLEYLHNLVPHAIVHGDIKAANILISDHHQACLTDFGVAKMLDVTGYTTTPKGTIRFMSPELLKDHKASFTRASDIWALGMTILQVSTGKVPFNHIKRDPTIVLHVTEGELPSRPDEISESLWTLLRRCWASNPDKRPSISVVAIVLLLMTSQKLTSKDVEDLIDYLEHQIQENSKKTGNPERKTSTRDSLPRSEMAPTAVVKSHPFGCRWPECGAHFTTLSYLQPHELQHWIRWRSEDKNTQSRAKSVPAILFALA